MSERFDRLVGHLATLPMDRSLDGLDAEIGRDIADRRRDARTLAALAPVRVAAVALALAMGVTAGVAASAIVVPHPSGTFLVAANLAPSTLLEGGE